VSESLGDTEEAMAQMHKDVKDSDFDAKLAKLHIFIFKGIRLFGRILTAPFVFLFIVLLAALIVVVVGIGGPFVALVAAVRWAYGCKNSIPPSWTSK